MPPKYDCDAIIIGAGIGGLVCGCYLAKAGLKTIIIEKNTKPGGYCTTFVRNGFIFDACAHSLGGLSYNGNLFVVLKELGILSRLNLKRANPTDIIITKKYKINFWNDIKHTIKEIQSYFPKEKGNIENFFKFITTCTGFDFYSLKKLTFEQFLNKYFTNKYLRTILSVPLFGNSGLPPSKLSCFTAITIYKDFIIGGGYYLPNGIQDLPDTLADRFSELGGKVLYSTVLNKILVKNQAAIGIETSPKQKIFSKYVVSDIDALKTFKSLVSKRAYEPTNINNMTQTSSGFTCYLSIDNKISLPFKEYSNVWFFSNLNLDYIYTQTKKARINLHTWYLLFTSPRKKTTTISILVPYKNPIYWEKNKIKFLDFLVNKATRIIPNLSKHLIAKDASTPQTLYETTFNMKGAAFGWESTPLQFSTRGLSQITSIKNLYLSGHWTSIVQGISGVSYIGRSTSRLIIKKETKTK
ncbi:MAG: NAD(P)/FAD-dependent oxidoreductase [Candidatus Omnitrophica bacterium]|nr:NAD(P)/FAD-dependent oxidoreductase [Candidatus Omnitrophota bacterium]